MKKKNIWKNVQVGKINPLDPPYAVPCSQCITLISEMECLSSPVSFSWGQQEVNKGQVFSGTYRILFTDAKTDKTIYSNEFTIKEGKKITVDGKFENLGHPFTGLCNYNRWDLL